jgi:formate-dependent nitrite reductase membrane component NrfD
MIVAGLATVYTSFLFAQGIGRDLWQTPLSAVDLLALAMAEGAAVLLLAALVPGLAPRDVVVRSLEYALVGALGVHLVLLAVEHLLTPSPTRHHALAVESITIGPLSVWFWGGAVLLGGLVPVACIVAAATTTVDAGILVSAAAGLTLAGALVWEYVWVEAGQSVPLS